MKLCFPVKDAASLESKVYGHFGSAPTFMLVDTDTKDIKVLSNPDQQHVKGKCNPIATIAGEALDGIIVGGIGGGALKKLNMAGVTVYQAKAETIGENLLLFELGQLPEFKLGQVCAGHGHGCAH